jgi:hypothetical protein
LGLGAADFLFAGLLENQRLHRGIESGSKLAEALDAPPTAALSGLAAGARSTKMRRMVT